MAKIDELVEQFLALKKIAVVGVSDRRETGCNMNYQKFKNSGYTTYAINPRLDSFDGELCYPNLKALPEKPEGVFILANPKVTEQIVQECVELGIKHVWMHCMMGTRPGLAAGITSVSSQAVKICHENSIQVIPGSCPNQFLKPDIGHRMMHGIWRIFGLLTLNA